MVEAIRTFMALEFPNIDPVALAIGPFEIRWYALAYLAGFLLGWRYCLKLARLDQNKRPGGTDIDDVLTWIIIGVILGGRIGYVLFYNFSYYISEPLDALKIWHGGMSFHGGALGVIIAMILFARVRDISFLRLADIICAAVPIGLFFGRIANFINGELFGRVGDVPWAIVFPHGGDLPRHPSQLYEALLEGAVLFLILRVFIQNDRIRNMPGFVSGAFLLGYGMFRAFIEFFRQPDEQIGLYFDLISQGQILCIPMIVVGAGYMLWAFMKNDNYKS